MCFYFFKWKMLSIKKKFGLSSGFWIFSKGINLHGSKDHNLRGGFFRSTPPAVNLQLKDDLSLSRSSRAVDLAIEAGLSRLPGGNPNLEGVTLFLPYRVWGLGHAPLYPNLSRRGLLANLTWTEGLTWIAWPTPGGGGGGSKGGTTRGGGSRLGPRWGL